MSKIKFRTTKNRRQGVVSGFSSCYQNKWVEQEHKTVYEFFWVNYLTDVTPNSRTVNDLIRKRKTFELKTQAAGKR